MYHERTKRSVVSECFHAIALKFFIGGGTPSDRKCSNPKTDFAVFGPKIKKFITSFYFALSFK